MQRRNSVIIVIATVAVCLILVSGASALHFVAKGKVVPSYYYGGLDLGLLDSKIAMAKISAHKGFLEEHARTEITVDGQTKEYSYSDISLNISAPDKAYELPVYGDNVNFRGLVVSMLKKDRFPMIITSNQAAAQSLMYKDFPTLKRSSNPHFKLDDAGGLITVSGKMGREFDPATFYEDITATLYQTPDKSLGFEIEAEVVNPVFSKEEVLLAKPSVEKLLVKSVSFTAGEDTDSISLDTKDLIDLVRFEKIEFEVEPYIDELAFADFVKDNFAESFTKQAGEVSIAYNAETERAEFTGDYSDGTEITFGELYRSFQEGVFADATDNNLVVTVPIEKVSGRVIADEQLTAMGVKGLYAQGHTSFYGSSSSRMHNISVGLDNYNGMIIKPGEVFSFNDVLGEVDASTGYLPELVIKQEGTIPEYGGGLCQVSTTLYRAVLNADLPIIERRPHSYAVSYYAQQLGHGLDATIYPGVSDFSFENNTDTALIVESFKEGANAYFRLYGAVNNSTVEYDGPYVSRYISPGSAISIPDARLAPGARKQVEKPHTGFDVTWYKITTMPDGTTDKKEIFSRYRAIPAKFRVGPAVTEVSSHSSDESNTSA